MKNLVIALSVVLAVALPSAADVVLVDMTLASPTSTQNTFLMTLDVSETYGEGVATTTTTTLSGTSKINLNVTTDPVTNEVTGISTIELLFEEELGPIDFADTSFYYDFDPENPGLAYLTATGVGISGTYKQGGEGHYVQGPPSVVTPSPASLSGTFDLADTELYLDDGVFTFHEYFGAPTNTVVFDLNNPNIPEPAAHFDVEGTGSISVSLASVVGDLATYDVDLVMPAYMETRLWTVSGVRLGFLGCDGTTVMSGQMTRTIVVSNTPGDANHDGVVDDQDASILASNWRMASGAQWADGDFNGDGAVNDRDASILASHWHYGVAEGGAPAPEPSTVVGLIGLALAGLLVRRRR